MKRSDDLIDLSREHHSALRLARQLQRGERVPDLARQLDALLAHFAAEEQRFADVLDTTPGDRALYTRLRNEHADLEQALRQAVRGLGLARAGELLVAHVRFEERELFERIEALGALVEI